jgi:transposase
VEDRLRAASPLVGGRDLGPDPASVQADADLAGRVDWLMVGVDSTSCRARQHAAGARTTRPRVPKKGTTPRHHRPDEGLGHSRGGPTCKIHLAGEGGCRPVVLLLTPGQRGGAPHLVEVLDRIRCPGRWAEDPATRPDHVSGDTAYSSRRNRRYPRRRRIRHTIPEPEVQRTNRKRRGSAGGRPVGFDRDRYRRRNEVGRTVNRLKNSRAVATRYDKRAYVFHGTVTAAAIRLWLRE